MTGNLTLLKSSEGINPIMIDLPNTDHTLATKQGTVEQEKMNLHKVLFVPDLSCNIISIARVSKDLNCTVTCFDNFFVLQGRTLRMLIGVSEQRDKVYYYK